jgi:hypothetical protein
MKPCAHQNLRPGLPILRRWGTYKSVVCSDCGAFLQLTHFDEPVGSWQSAENYAAATAEREEL